MSALEQFGKNKTVTVSLQQTYILLLSGIFSFSSSTVYQRRFGTLKSEARVFFPIALYADCCDIVLRAEAIEHILGFVWGWGGQKKGKDGLKATLLQN